MGPQTIFVIGECMIELQRDGAGLAYRFGGDTLNAAVYLARLVDPARHRIAYVSALGTDSMSDQMLLCWQNEGIETRYVQRLPEKLPGIYLIENEPDGERHFHYWRNDSAARYWLRGPRAEAILDELARAPFVVLSGIGLAILTPAHREILLDTLARCRQQGGRIFFDNNYRGRLWESSQVAADCYRRVLALTDIALLTLEDETDLYGHADVDEVIARTRALGVPEVVIKRGDQPCIVQTAETRLEIASSPVVDVVDTTAAGDSFSAAYLAARLIGRDPAHAAMEGHRLAGAVIRHRGAIIPRNDMPR